MSQDGMSYDDLMRELSRGVVAREAARRLAVERHDNERAAAAEELRRARAEAVGAQRRRHAADDLFTRVQHDAAHQWQRLRGRVPGRTRARLGVLPRLAEPSRAQVMVDHPAEGASELIGEAKDLLDELHGRPALSGGAYPLLVVLGVVCTALAYLAARGLLTLGHRTHGPVGTVLDTVGQIAAFASPLGGLPVLKLFVDRGGARVDAGAVAAVVLAGVATLAGFGMLLGR